MQAAENFSSRCWAVGGCSGVQEPLFGSQTRSRNLRAAGFLGRVVLVNPSPLLGSPWGA